MNHVSYPMLVTVSNVGTVTAFVKQVAGDYSGPLSVQ